MQTWYNHNFTTVLVVFYYVGVYYSEGPLYIMVLCYKICRVVLVRDRDPSGLDGQPEERPLGVDRRGRTAAAGQQGVQAHGERADDHIQLGFFFPNEKNFDF